MIFWDEEKRAKYT